MTPGAPTNNALFDWIRKNIISILLISSGVIAAYVRLDSQVNQLEKEVIDNKFSRDKELAQINNDVELIRNSYVTRTELNSVVISRMDRIESKIDRLIEAK